MRIGILGGSFNPIHNTHLAIATVAGEQLSLDRVLFIPAGTPPHKRADRTLAAPEHRLRMVELALADIHYAEASDVELVRQGPSYTCDTLANLRERFGDEAELFFLIGSDQALELPTWRRVDEIMRMCRLVVVERPGYPLAALDKLADRLPKELIDALKSNTLKLPPSPVSSTEIRRRLSEGRDVSDLVPPAVVTYIRAQGLYRTSARKP